jgi:hypothetical protein
MPVAEHEAQEWRSKAIEALQSRPAIDPIGDLAAACDAIQGSLVNPALASPRRRPFQKALLRLDPDETEAMPVDGQKTEQPERRLK